MDGFSYVWMSDLWLTHGLSGGGDEGDFRSLTIFEGSHNTANISNHKMTYFDLITNGPYEVRKLIEESGRTIICDVPQS